MRDVMMDAPSPVPDQLVSDLSLRTVPPKA